MARSISVSSVVSALSGSKPGVSGVSGRMGSGIIGLMVWCKTIMSGGGKKFLRVLRAWASGPAMLAAYFKG